MDETIEIMPETETEEFEEESEVYDSYDSPAPGDGFAAKVALVVASVATTVILDRCAAPVAGWVHKKTTELGSKIKARRKERLEAKLAKLESDELSDE